MKTILRLKQGVLVLVAAVAMTSCLKSEDDPFQIGAAGYVDQVITENYSEFTPVILAQSFQVIEKCNVRGPGGEYIIMKKMANQYTSSWITDVYTPFTELPSGVFTVTATNQEAESASITVHLNNTVAMKTQLKGSIAYESKKVEAEFNEVENATDYLIVIKESESATYYETVVIGNYSAAKLKESNWKVSLEESSYASKITGLETGKSYYLTIAAVIANTNSSLLYQESSESAVFTK